MIEKSGGIPPQQWTEALGSVSSFEELINNAALLQKYANEHTADPNDRNQAVASGVAELNLFCERNGLIGTDIVSIGATQVVALSDEGVAKMGPTIDNVVEGKLLAFRAIAEELRTYSKPGILTDRVLIGLHLEPTVPKIAEILDVEATDSHYYFASIDTAGVQPLNEFKTSLIEQSMDRFNDADLLVELNTAIYRDQVDLRHIAEVIEDIQTNPARRWQLEDCLTYINHACSWYGRNIVLLAPEVYASTDQHGLRRVGEESPEPDGICLGFSINYIPTVGNSEYLKRRNVKSQKLCLAVAVEDELLFVPVDGIEDYQVEL